MTTESISETTQVIVAGAGPAGLCAAINLAQNGVKVMVIDRRPLDAIGRRLRVSVEEQAFGAAGLEVPDRPVRLHKAEALEIISPDNHYKVKVTNLPLVSLDLHLFVQQLLHKAQLLGVRVLTETAVTGPIIQDDRVTGIVGAGADGRLIQIQAPLTIDATGVVAAVRHQLEPHLGIPPNIDPNDVVSAWQASHEIDREVIRDLLAKNRVRPMVNVCRVGFMGPCSVFSIFLDLEDDRVDITVGLQHDPKLTPARELVEAYVNSHHWVRDPIAAGGGLIPVRRPVAPLVSDGLALVGDAACQAFPTHASGVANAIIAARILAETATNALEQDDTSMAALWPYNLRYFIGRGAAQANADLFRRFLLTLSSDDLGDLFNQGIVTSEGITGALESMPLELPHGAVAGAAIPLIKKPGLLLKMAKLNRSVHKALQLYLDLPPEPDPIKLQRWHKAAAKLFP